MSAPQDVIALSARTQVERRSEEALELRCSHLPAVVTLRAEGGEEATQWHEQLMRTVVALLPAAAGVLAPSPLPKPLGLADAASPKRQIVFFCTDSSDEDASGLGCNQHYY